MFKIPKIGPGFVDASFRKTHLQGWPIYGEGTLILCFCYTCLCYYDDLYIEATCCGYYFRVEFFSEILSEICWTYFVGVGVGGPIFL